MTSESRKIQLEASVDATGAKKGFDDIKAGARDMAQAVGQAGQQAGQGLAKLGDGAPAAAEKVEGVARRISDSLKRIPAAAKDATVATDGLTQAQARFLASLDKQAVLKTQGIAAYQELRAAQLGVGDAAAASIAKIRAAEQGTTQLGMSAKATAAAMRQVPAQFQDIVVSLQAGQQPMTVLLQQGSQLSTVFGGTGAAAKALGGFVLGLVNPFTVTAAAVAGFAFAMSKAEDSLRQANTIGTMLQATGRGADFSREQIKALRIELEHLPGVSKEFADATISEFAKTAQIGGTMFQDLSRLVADYAAATGTTVPNAAKALAKAFADPAQGAKQLEEQLGTLTAAQVLTIQKLVEVGDRSGAQKVLFDALRDSVKGLAESGMTPLQRATNDFGNAWGDAMRSLDQSSPLRNANALLAQMLGYVTGIIKQGGFGGAVAGSITGALSGFSKGGLPGFAIGQGIGLLSGFLGGTPAQTGGATGGWDDPNKALDDQVKTLLAATTSYKSATGAIADMRQQASALTRTLNELKAAGKGNGVEAEALADRLKGVNEKIRDAENALSKKGRGPSIKTNAFDVQEIREYAAGLDAFAKIASNAAAKSDDLSKTQEKLQELQASPVWASYSRQQQEQLIYVASLAQAEEDRAAATKLAGQISKEAVQAIAEGQKARDDAVRSGFQAAAAAEAELQQYGLLKSQVQELTLAKLEEARASAALAGEEISDIDKRIEAQKRLIAATRGIEIKKGAEDARKEWERTADSINQSLTDALLRGFESGKSFAQNFRDTVRNMFSTLVLRPIIQGVVTPVSGAMSSFSQSLMGGMSGNGTAGAGGGMGNTLMNNAGLIGAGYQYLTGASVGASQASLVAANGVQALGGDGLGTLIAGNGGWAGVAAGGASAAGFGAAGAAGAYGAGAAGASAIGGAALTGSIGGATAGGYGIATGAAFAAEGAAAAGTAAAAGSSIAAGASAVMAAIPVVGWIALAAVALYSIFGKKGGGQKQDGRFGQLASGVAMFDSDLTPQNNAVAKQAAQGVQGQYDAINKAFGGKGGIQYGLGFSLDPKGDSPTFLDVTGRRDGQVAVNQTNMNVGRSEDELKAAIADMTARATLAGLQQSNLKGILGEYLSQLGDVATLSSETVTEAITRLQKAATERDSLEATYFDLTHTAVEKLIATRQKERAAIDEANRALYDQITIMQDLQATATAAAQAVDGARGVLTDAYQRESSALQGVIDRHTNYAKQLRALRDSLLLGDASPLGRGAKTGQAGLAFQNTLTGAIAGNEDALQGLGGAGQALLEAAKNSARSPVELAAAFAKVQAGLTTAASASDGRASVAQQQLEAMTAQLSALGVLNQSVVDVRTALSGYLAAVNQNLAAQSAIQQAQLQYAASIAAQQSAPPPTATAVAQVSSVPSNVVYVGPVTGTNYTYGQALDQRDLPQSFVGGFAKGGLARGGIAMVGEDGPELVDFSTPGRVYTNDQTRGMFAPSNATLEPLLREVTKKLDVLVDSVRTGDVAMLQQLATVASKLKKFDTIGMPPVRD
jgi:hypothetical protein